MAKQPNAQGEQAHFMRLLEYSDECLARLQSTLAESLDRASLNSAGAFAPLGELCSQLADRAKGGVAASTPSSSTDTTPLFPSAVALCFAYRDSKTLVQKLNAAAKAASRWRPIEQHLEERPALVLGDHEETIERWKQDAEMENSQRDRVDERTHRQSIVKAMNAVFTELARHQASIREQVQSKELKPGKSRRWTQRDVDKEIQKLRTAGAAKIKKLRQLINRDEESAKREAKKLYTRNAIARKLKASGALISRSPEWQELADQLGLPRGRKTAGRRNFGFDEAVELASEEQHDRAAPVASLLEQVREQVPSDVFDAVREQFAAGQLTDQEVRDAFGEYLDQGESDFGTDDRS